MHGDEVNGASSLQCLFLNLTGAQAKPFLLKYQGLMGEPMGIAGLWSSWRSPSGWVESYAMLTVKADNYPIFKQLHKPQNEKRILVILNPDSFQPWLIGAEIDAKTLIRQCPAETLQLQSSWISSQHLFA